MTRSIEDTTSVVIRPTIRMVIAILTTHNAIKDELLAFIPLMKIIVFIVNEKR